MAPLVTVPQRTRLGGIVRGPLNLLQAFGHFKTADTPRKKIALLIAPTYGGDKNFWGLVSPINDAREMKDLLTKLGYTIRTLHEGPDADDLPTRDNIKKAIDEFILEEGDVDYFLMYAGHSYQKVAEGPTKEEDGKTEYIIPCDALRHTSDSGERLSFNDAVNTDKVIFDTELNEALVSKIEKVKGSQLVAIFDSCHSCTLLNLKHHRCNRVGNFKSILRRISRRALIEPVQNHVGLSLARTETQRSIDLQPRSSDDGNIPPIMEDSLICLHLPLLTQYSQKKQCSGFCPRVPTWEKPPVVCISASKDSQYTIEDNEGGTLITAFVKLFNRGQQTTYEEVMIAAQKNVATRREKYLQEINTKYKEKKKKAAEEKGYHPELSRFAYFPELRAEKMRATKMVKERCDPQLSSMRPLRMKATLSL